MSSVHHEDELARLKSEYSWLSDDANFAIHDRAVGGVGGLNQCERCKSSSNVKALWTKQMRSVDEGMTTMYECQTCLSRWKS